MNPLHTILNQHWYKQYNILLTLLLAPLSVLFAGMIRLRYGYYQIKNKLVYKEYPFKIIIIGNLTVGGSGKTPLVIETVRYCQSLGLSPVVISRGYGRQNKDLQVVSTTSAINAVGDEPLYIYQQAHCPVIVHADRKKSLSYIQQHYPECRVVISDDGLQHYNLYRDIEVIALDQSRSLGNGWLLPMGPLREPEKRLARADLIMHKVQEKQEVQSDQFCIQIKQFRNTKTGTCVQADYFHGKDCIAFAGIAHPDGFFQQLKTLGIQAKTFALEDHGLIDNKLLSKFKSFCMITTEKDVVKYPADENLWVAETTLVVHERYFQEIRALLHH